VSELVDRAVYTVKNKILPSVTDFCPAGPVHRCIHSVAHLIEDHAQRLGVSARFCATKLIEGDESLIKRLTR
jgi:ferrous iron transport protein B